MLARPVAAGERTVMVLSATGTDDRLDAAREAIGFWNAVLTDLGVEARVGDPRIVVDSPVARQLENYARQITQRAFRLPAGDWEPDAPEVLTRLDVDIVVLLSRQDIMSFTWPLPRVDPPRYLVIIRSPRSPDRDDVMVSQHVLAHELGHALGLFHNDSPHTLMCGPCQPLIAEPDGTGFLPLTESERARLVELNGGHRRP